MSRAGKDRELSSRTSGSKFIQPLLETICHCCIKLKVQIPHQVHTPGKPCVEEDSPPRCPQSTVCSSETSGQPRHS